MVSRTRISLHLNTKLRDNTLPKQLDLNESHVVNRYHKEHSVALILGVSHHVMIGNHKHKYKDTQKIGKETEVLIINHD